MTFKELGIVEPILRALKNAGYTKPTPIQEQSIPILLRGKNLLGCAQTGTGKTAAFSIPIIQHIYNDRQKAFEIAKQNGQRGRRHPYREIQALIVTPTRELAIQIGENFRNYGKYTGTWNTVIFGGVKQGSQTRALEKGVDVLIATPGRLLDLIGQGYISLDKIKYFVLDEADHMLDMGFIHDIKKIIAKLPVKRQSLFFSATMPKSITTLANKILGEKPERVTIAPEQTTAERVEQAVYFVTKKNKIKLLIHLIEEEQANSVLVFSRTKHGANKIVTKLEKSGIGAAAIHGNKSQGARQKALNAFKRGDLGVLVATDIAARGIDVDQLELVINYDLPNVPETYVHRIGRTGRAQASGIALSFCDNEERAYLRDIQKLIDDTIPIVEDQPYVDDSEEVAPKKQGGRSGRGGGGRGRNNRSRHSSGGNKSKSSSSSKSNRNRRW